MNRLGKSIQKCKSWRGPVRGVWVTVYAHNIQSNENQSPNFLGYPKTLKYFEHIGGPHKLAFRGFGTSTVLTKSHS